MLKDKLPKILLCFMVLGAFALPLAGCTLVHPLWGNTSISVDEHGTLLVGSCSDINLREIRVQSRERFGGTWKIDSVGEIKTRLFEGDFVTIGGENAQIRFVQGGAIDGSKYRSGNEVALQLFGEPYDVPDSVDGGFVVPNGGLQSGTWYFTDGSTSSKVCGAYERRHETAQ